MSFFSAFFFHNFSGARTYPIFYFEGRELNFETPKYLRIPSQTHLYGAITNYTHDLKNKRFAKARTESNYRYWWSNQYSESHHSFWGITTWVHIKSSGLLQSDLGLGEPNPQSKLRSVVVKLSPHRSDSEYKKFSDSVIDFLANQKSTVHSKTFRMFKPNLERLKSK